MRTPLLYVFAVAALVGATSAAQQSTNGNGRRDEWPRVYGNLENAYHSALEEISTATVKSLGATWQSAEFDDGAVSRSALVVVNGRMFLTAGPWVYAFDPKTGATIWKARPDGGSSAQGGVPAGEVNPRLVARLPSTRGVAVGGGLVYVGLVGGEVMALEEATGSVVWTTHIGEVPAPRGQRVSTVPVYADGKVFLGLGDADYALRGRMVALDAKTGRELWRFYSVPGPGEPGHETWQQDNDYWKRGGGGVWLVAAMDPALNLVYFQTGNPVPMAGGEVRGGDNLYTASIVALDATTGRRRWHFQMVHHDIWDADAAVSPVLFDAPFAGRMRKALAAVRRDGDLFILDRETGKPLLPVEERAVPQDPSVKTSRTQPFTAGAESWLPSCEDWKKLVTPPEGLRVGCQYEPLSFNSNALAPQFSVRIAPVSYNPQTRYLYISGSNGLVSRRRVSHDPYFIQISGRPVPGVNKRVNVLAALDSRTLRVAWKRELSPGEGVLQPSGALTTAGGLLLRSIGDGTVEASDARTGQPLWSFRTGAAGGTGPFASYSIDGRQYLAAAAGRRVVVFALGGMVSEAAAAPGAGNAVPNEEFAGIIRDVTEIETTSLLTSSGIVGTRYAIDEHTFNPTRARAKAGTPLAFMNNGAMLHTIVARDGSWTSGLLTPGSRVFISLKPGTYVYRCKEHPWALGELIVE